MKARTREGAELMFLREPGVLGGVVTASGRPARLDAEGAEDAVVKERLNLAEGRMRP